MTAASNANVKHWMAGKLILDATYRKSKSLLELHLDDGSTVYINSLSIGYKPGPEVKR